jgi:hypothetical protein
MPARQSTDVAARLFRATSFGVPSGAVGMHCGVEVISRTLFCPRAGKNRDVAIGLVEVFDPPLAGVVGIFAQLLAPSLLRIARRAVPSITRVPRCQRNFGRSGQLFHRATPRVRDTAMGKSASSKKVATPSPACGAIGREHALNRIFSEVAHITSREAGRPWVFFLPAPPSSCGG